MTDHRFATLDVFTDTRFCGNPLAVVWDCDDVDDDTMRAVAREFGYSETVFLQTTNAPGCDLRTRIYTPTGELPFAGHPTIGSAVALESQFGDHMTFDQLAGPVAVKVGGGRAVFTIDRTVELGPVDEISRELVATAIGLEVDDLVTGGRQMSAGNPFLAVQLASLGALARVQVGEVPTALALYLYVYVATGHAAIRARLLAPHQGIPEDPATGSAAAALAGVLAETSADGPVGFSVEQGIEMSRPSRIDVAADVVDGRAVRVGVEGAAVIVTEGLLHLA